MVIQTTAPDRRTLVKSISEHLGEEAVYKGPPTFAYMIGQVTVNRESQLILPEDMDPAGIQGFLVSRGWLERNELNISFPAGDLTVKAMHNLIFLLYSKQYLINKAIGGDTLRIEDAVITRLKEPLPKSIDDFKALVHDLKTHGLIAGVDFADDSITLTFPLSEDAEITSAFTELTARIIAAAREATRVSPERQQPENEKYYMRSWLVRLGLGGQEAKSIRRVLLKGLMGHSAFQSDLEAQRHRDKYAEIRRVRKGITPVEVQHDET